MRMLILLPVAVAVLLFPRSGRAEAAPPADRRGVDFFEKNVRPVLAQHCHRCHSAKATKLKAGLRLDTREGLLAGGEGGAVVVPGRPEKSRLIEAIGYHNDDLRMPPKVALPEKAVADLTKWVKMGAPWPQEVAAAGAGATPAARERRNLAGVDFETLRRTHWAWQPVAAPAVPQVKDARWPRNDSDRFLLAKMEAAGIKPVGDADRVTLIRRATLDLTGLPPEPQDVESFLGDQSTSAFEKVVDRLLASPAFGERWGRHWLDVARYAESTGSTRNVPYSFAWRYRDYVIDAYNADKPYDRFVTEQIAGDLLPHSDAARRDEHLVATGFLALGVKDLNEGKKFQFLMDTVDEQIDVTSRAVLASTVSCARCHDHKFDPVTTEEYYALAGIFRSTRVMAGVQGRRGGNGGGYFNPDQLLKLGAGGSSGGAPAGPPAPPRPGAGAEASGGAELKRLAAKVDAARAELKRLRKAARAAEDGKGRKRQDAGGGRRELARKKNEVEALEARLSELQRAAAAPVAGSARADAGSAGADAVGPLALGVCDEEVPSDARVCVRGEVDTLGPAVPRGFVGLVGVPAAPSIDPARSGRLELAEWMTHAENPLTARVAVNRIWLHLFGQGLVRTVDNFGTTGEAPSHPELLDHLAARFVREGWSTKKAIRAVVLSRAYQLAGSYDAAGAAVDPANRLVWRSAPRRLEAEAIRDGMLAAAGRLDPARPAGSPVAGLPVVEVREGAGNARNPGAGRLAEGAHYRSVYLPILRGAVPAVLDVFDFAEPTMVTGARDVTTVATHALFLMNNPFVLEQAGHLAARVLTAPADDDAGRVDLAYKLTLARPATPAERERALRYVTQYAGQNPAAAKDAAKARAEAWASFCQALFASAEFRYVQ